jgi:hypothetical protein
MLKLQEGQFVKITGTEVKNENDIFVVQHDYNIEGKYAVVHNEYCLNKVKLDGTMKESGYTIVFYNEHFIKSNPDLQIRIVTDLKKAKKEVNEYLKNLNNNEMVVEFVRAENQEVQDKSLIRFPNGLKFGTFGEKHIGSRRLWLVRTRDNGSIYIEEVGKKGQKINTGKYFGCTLGLTNKIKEVCEVVEKVETRKGDLVKESKKVEIKPVEVIEEVVETAEEQTQQIEEENQNVEESKTETIINNELNVEVKFNSEKNGIELYFSDKPSDDFRSQLKANKFRWNGRLKCWYVKDTNEARDFLKGLGVLNEEGTQENNVVVESEIKPVEEVEIDINNINEENFPISKELSKRENDSNWIFRTKERDHQQEILSYLNAFQEEYLETIEKLESGRNKFNSWINSFKKRYYQNYYARLKNKADNPSWAVTGSANRNARKDAKMNSRFDNLMREGIALDTEFKDKMYQIKNKIQKEEGRKFAEAVNSNTRKFEYKIIRKMVNIHVTDNYFNGENLQEKNCYMTSVNGQTFYILKTWGSFRAVDINGMELNIEHCATLKDMKDILNYYLAQMEKEAV